MAKRKSYKRPRRKQALHQSHEMLLQDSDTFDEIEDIENEGTPLNKKGGSSERLLEQRSPESVLFESEQLELSCYDDLSPEIVPRLRRRKLDLNSSDRNNEGNESKESQKGSELIEVKQENEIPTQETDVPAEKCFPMEKTLSMNDEIKLEMNDCESLKRDRSSSKTGHEICTYDTNLYSSTSAYDLPCGYISEPARCTAFNSDVHHFLDEFKSTISACAPVDEFQNKYFEKWSSEEGQSTRFEVINEKTSQNSSSTYFNANWSECRRIISNLRQLNGLKMRTTTQECITHLLSKYKKCEETKPLQASSFSSNTPSSLTSQENSNKCINKRSFTETDRIEEFTEIGNNGTRIRARSTTPCSGSPPPAKRCRTTLKFDDEEETQQSEKATVSIAVTDLLPEEKKSVQHSFGPSTTITKIPWSTCTSESPSTSTLDLPFVSDSGGCSRSLEEQERLYSKKCACCNSQENIKSPTFRLFKKPITKVVLFCVWFLKRLGNVFIKSCRGFKKVVLVCSSTKQTHKLEELSQIVIMLHSDTKQMSNTFLEKVNDLSEKLTQVRASHVATLDALTTEVGSMQKVNRRLAENNETLMQELRKLQNMLQDTRRRSPKPPPPPPPPPPPLPPPMPSILCVPPPPPPPAFSQSPAQPITPTTPNSSKNIRTPSRKCSTPLFNRPAITVEDLLKVTLRKAPQNVKENRRNTLPGPRGPVVSLDMLRSVKLKSARRRSDQITRSPRSARMIKTRTAPSLSLSPIMTGTDNSLGRILKQVDVNRRGPRRLLSSMTNCRENKITKDISSQDMNSKDSDSQSEIV